MVAGMSRAVFMQRSMYFYSIQVREPRMHFMHPRVEHWADAHLRILGV